MKLWAGSEELDSAASEDGYTAPSLTSRSVPCVDWLSQAMNCAACCGCLESAVTEVAEPPHAPETLWPALHCGSCAIAQSPEVFAACDSRSPGAQTAEIQLAYSPEEKDLSQ